MALSPEAWELISQRADGRPFPTGAICLIGLRDLVPLARLQPVPVAAASALLAYVPPAVIDQLQRGRSNWLAELRRVTVLFVNFPGLSAATPLDRAQTVMRELQTILHRYEGTINKLSADDKGASLVAALGLPPLAHEDDAVRAVRAALAFRDRLGGTGVRTSIGIATGLAFCGVVGNMTRREYTMIGDVVNLAGRLMQAAHGDILCDDATYDVSRAPLVFEALPSIGKLPKEGSPKAVVIDDAQWLDSASWALASCVASRQAPVLVAFSMRPVAEAAPEEVEGICRASRTRRVQLSALSAEDAIDVARRCLGVAHLPEPVETIIRSKAEGNPLFSEELACTLRDGGLIRISNGECHLAPTAGDLDAVDLPATMQGAVMARIDRLATVAAAGAEGGQRHRPRVQKAGEQAMRSYANHEAIAFLDEALRLLRSLPEGAERARKELALCCALGAPLIVTKGFAAPETERAYARAYELCQRSENTPELFGAVSGLWNFYLVKTQLARARELFHLAEESGRPELLLPAHRAVGETSFWLGDLTSAREHLEEATGLYCRELHEGEAFRTGQDPGVVCRGFAAWNQWLLGYPDAALATIEQAHALASDLAHPHSIAMALQNFAMTHQFRGEPAAALEKAQALVELSHREGFALWSAGATVMRGWALFALGQANEGVAGMRRGVDDWRATGAELPIPYYLCLLASAHLAAYQAEEGLELIREALAASDRSGEAWWRAELWRLDAELRLALQIPDEAGAERSVAEALDFAACQTARSLELRAASTLLRLRHKQGKGLDDARRRLAAIREWFSEGFQTRDLEEAALLLDASGGRG